MKILVDDEGDKMISQLCDVALKSGGISDLKAINTIIASTKRIEETTDATKKGKESKDNK